MKQILQKKCNEYSILNINYQRSKEKSNFDIIDNFENIIFEI
jgi:hypothetical protein